jgi:hypothetical protein
LLEITDWPTAGILRESDHGARRLLQQIPEILERIMRDKHRRSISRKEVKAELAPFLAREQKPFATWWKLRFVLFQ